VATFSPAVAVRRRLLPEHRRPGGTGLSWGAQRPRRGKQDVAYRNPLQSRAGSDRGPWSQGGDDVPLEITQAET